MCFPTCRRLVAALLVCALLAPSAALAQSQDPPTPPTHHSKKTAILVTVMGLGLVGLGAAALAAGDSGCTEGEWGGDGSGLGVYCEPIPSLNDNRSRKIAGGIAIGLGSVVAIWGLLSMRGNHPSPSVGQADRLLKQTVTRDSSLSLAGHGAALRAPSRSDGAQSVAKDGGLSLHDLCYPTLRFGAANRTGQ